LPENPPEYPDESNGEAGLLSFVVRLWKEESASEERQTSWRGHITPVPNGKRHYFSDLNEILAFIAAHLEEQR